MDHAIVHSHRDRLLDVMPEISDYNATFQAINRRWSGAITAGMIETGCMSPDAAKLFTPLIQDMRATKTKYGGTQVQLVDAILFEIAKKAVLEITDAAKFTINILKRNLFERTADVGYLATDAEIVNFLKQARTSDDPTVLTEQAEFIQKRLTQYRYEYTVYNEIIILDLDGNVQSNLDKETYVTRSTDPLLGETQAIELHSRLDEDKYIETFRQTDLRPGRGNVLIYSQKIEDPDTQNPLGTLCLCFDFEDEMSRIFKDLNQGNDNIIAAILDSGGHVVSSNKPEVLSLSEKVSIDLDADFKFLTFAGRTYLASIVATDGYQGFYGLTWYGLAMIEIKAAFQKDPAGDGLDSSFINRIQHNFKELSVIKKESDELLNDMKIDSINGQVQAAKFNAKAFVEILHFVKSIGQDIDDLFSSAIENLQQAVVTSLFNDVQFRAFQGNNIADRNLYERANDVCWWALTPLFRLMLTKHGDGGLNEADLRGVTENLQYINNLYTPYLRLVLVAPDGVVVAVSNPPEELEEKFSEDDLPRGQAFVGFQLDKSLVKKAMHLPSSKDYCVSNFEPTPLYGGRSTYIYSTAVRDPEKHSRTVGAIQIVFDSEPQFLAMLMDTLPKDEKKEIVAGSFGIFSDRNKSVISTTNPAYPVGSRLSLEDSLFEHPRGHRASTIIEMNKKSYALGLQVSNGYREYKCEDGYVNDVVCMIFVPI